MFSASKLEFFEHFDNQHLALSYDDVRLQTCANKYNLLDKIDTESSFSRNVSLKAPLVSAAMDTVTESEMAISMAKMGGLGIIHAALPVDTQRKEVRRVKKSINELIEDPVSVKTSSTLAEVQKLIEDKRYSFTTFPVLNNEGNFVGMLGGDDFKYPDSLEISVEDAMTDITEVISADPETSTEEAYRIMQSNKKSTLPLVKDGKVSGLYLFSDVSRTVRESEKYNVDSNGQLFVGAAISTYDERNPDSFYERAEALSKYTDVIVIDTADGDSYYAFDTLKRLKEFRQTSDNNFDIVVGNISNGPSARELANEGADGIKVGQGPGSICTTRRETGIGMPQVSAVAGCVRSMFNNHVNDAIPVCADGGITQYGDIPIAIASGANSVMMGGMFAGTNESPGEITVDPDGNKHKIYRGMGSASALRDNEASRKRYESNADKIVLAEGVEKTIAYKGSVVSVADLCMQALTKGMRYTKSPNITTLQSEVELIRITNAGMRESLPHDV